MTTKAELEKVSNLAELEKLGIGKVIVEVSHRGGGLGFSAVDIVKAFGVELKHLPPKFGAACNYLGGGVRGAIFASGFSNKVSQKQAELLTALQEVCIRVYESVETEIGLNSETYEDGGTNWNAEATKMSRRTGQISAY